MILQIKVKPNSPTFRIENKNGQIIIYCKSPPESNKANREIVKELTNLTDRQVKIIRGLTSKKKTILIHNITEEEFIEMVL
jgi:uncharacterized protein (TIGR00251 family)